MAYEGDQFKTTVVASVDLSGAQHQFVNALGNITALPQAALGVVQNKPQALEHATVGIMGIVKVKAGGAIAAGKPFTCTTSGFAASVNSGIALGKAITAATSGSTFTGFLFGGPSVCASAYL